MKTFLLIAILLISPTAGALRWATDPLTGERYVTRGPFRDFWGPDLFLHGMFAHRSHWKYRGALHLEFCNYVVVMADDNEAGRWWLGRPIQTGALQDGSCPETYQP